MTDVPGPTKGFDNCWNEVLHGLRACDEDEEQALTPNSPIRDTKLECGPMWHWLGVGSLSESNTINSKSITSHELFFFIQEFPVCGWEIWQ